MQRIVKANPKPRKMLHINSIGCMYVDSIAFLLSGVNVEARNPQSKSPVKIKYFSGVLLHCDKCRTMAMKIAAVADGKDKDQVILNGEGIDPAYWTCLLSIAVAEAAAAAAAAVRGGGVFEGDIEIWFWVLGRKRPGVKSL
ncbi:hypothetical protein QUC31_001611 [Theobroma cacao]